MLACRASLTLAMKRRAQAALKNMIYGAAGVFDPQTVIDTVDST